MDNSHKKSFARALAWCYAWGLASDPKKDLSIFQKTRQALQKQSPEQIPEEITDIIAQIEELQDLEFPNTSKELQQITEKLPDLWQAKMGLVYGGATKIKGYVFEAAKLPDIRGASALLDRINLIDLPAFFDRHSKPAIDKWLEANFPGLQDGLIPELIVYSTGGNILAFCPAALADDLANAIEKRYTEETLTANSCAVGDTFKMLEVRFGLLPDKIDDGTQWLEWYKNNAKDELVKAYFHRSEDLEKDFQNRKSFNELVGKLATRFNQRRAGNILPNNLPHKNRPSRRYPPMFETHPYLVRDESDRRNAIKQVKLPGEPCLSEVLARKRIFGQITKKEGSGGQKWYSGLDYDWEPGYVDSWVRKFRDSFQKTDLNQQYYENLPEKIRRADEVKEAKSLREIAGAEAESVPPTSGFVGYIYADGNNMGGYIQTIKTPQKYKQFSLDIFKATEISVYKAIAKHLQPRQVKNPDPDSNTKPGTWIHPFEIIAIGGDDVMLIVPADKALAIAQTIGEEFENYLISTGRYNLEESNEESKESHRYRPEKAPKSRCRLSTSVGVLITSDDTPIYYAENLTNQLLKSAKTKAKELNKDYNYHGGTIDFLAMKSVTMLTSNVKAFREEGLTVESEDKPTLKLYGSPYTLYEIGGILETAKALKESGFPRTQLYQMRSFLEQGKKTAMLNYRYFRARLDEESQELLFENFEKAWCKSKTNNGYLAPWMFLEGGKNSDKSIYETLWRELVDLYPFIEVAKEEVVESS